jgi:pimeloyl-ACP methyl ester carboxylesterase
LPAIRCPVIIRGLLDQVRLPRQATELAAGIAGSQLITSDSGHSTPAEDPDTVRQALISLATRIAASPQPVKDA